MSNHVSGGVERAGMVELAEMGPSQVWIVQDQAAAWWWVRGCLSSVHLFISVTCYSTSKKRQIQSAYLCEGKKKKKKRHKMLD